MYGHGDDVGYKSAATTGDDYDCGVENGNSHDNINDGDEDYDGDDNHDVLMITTTVAMTMMIMMMIMTINDVIKFWQLRRRIRVS